MQSDAPQVFVVDAVDEVAQKLMALKKRSLFSERFGTEANSAHSVGPGDTLEISVWEAPPAVLFGVGTLDAHTANASSRVTTFPEQMVALDGTVNVPFAGTIHVSGSTARQIESEIVRRLKGKANQPQVMVRVTRNASSNVTVVGEVATSVRVPLTPKGERLLDAIAAAGGVRQPVNKMTVQVTRDGMVESMPLDLVIQDPRQNIQLRAGDVVTALYQPNSFTVLGALGTNEEISFEAQGISLAQALGRSGGLQDQRADPHGVFIFRFENPEVFDVSDASLPRTPDGKIPVIYRVDLNDPRTFLVAQNFPMQNKDVMYVANAPAAELQKFLNILTASVFSVNNLINIGR